MHRKLIALAAAISMVLLVSGVATASITLFEAPLFHFGSVNTERRRRLPLEERSRWGDPGVCPNRNQRTVRPGGCRQHCRSSGEPPGFGSQSLRMSNACASGEFFYQTYSPQELQAVGEARPNKVFLAEFSVMSKTPAYQPGLFLSVSPDSGEGSRMSWVGLQDTPAVFGSASTTPPTSMASSSRTLARCLTAPVRTDQVLDQGQPGP